MLANDLIESISVYLQRNQCILEDFSVRMGVSTHLSLAWTRSIPPSGLYFSWKDDVLHWRSDRGGCGRARAGDLFWINPFEERSEQAFTHVGQSKQSKAHRVFTNLSNKGKVIFGHVKASGFDWETRQLIQEVGGLIAAHKRLPGQSGFWDMLHAFQKLAETRKDFVFLMSGKGPEKEKGMAWLHQHRLSDKIHFLGYVEDADLPTYFSFVDTFIAPMRDTAQDKARCPSKLFLYIPFQKPIITCKIGEPWELLREKGCYYLPGDAESLYMQLTKLVETPNKKIDLNLRLHTWDYRAIEFSNWIKNILRIKDEKN